MKIYLYIYTRNVKFGGGYNYSMYNRFFFHICQIFHKFIFLGKQYSSKLRQFNAICNNCGKDHSDKGKGSAACNKNHQDKCRGTNHQPALQIAKEAKTLWERAWAENRHLVAKHHALDTKMREFLDLVCISHFFKHILQVKMQFLNITN